MVESSSVVINSSRNSPASTSASLVVASVSSSSSSGGVRCGVLETRVRGAWYRVSVTLESDYLSVSLDESCELIDHSTILNGTIG